MMKILSIFLLVLTFSVTAQKPGLILVLQEKLVTTVANDVLIIVQDALNGLDLGGATGNTTDSPAISYFLSDITIGDLNIGKTVITPQPPSTVILAVEGISLNVTFGVAANTQGSTVMSNGTERVSLTAGALSLKITETVANGRLSFSAVPSLTITPKFTFTGKDTANVIPQVETYLKTSTTSQLTTGLETSVAGLIKDLNGLVSSIPNPVVIEKQFALDWTIVGALVNSDGFSSLESAAVVGRMENGSPNFTLPFTNTDTLPAVLPTTDQLQIILSEFTLNSLLYQVQQLDLIQLVITEKELPKNLPFSLNTTTFQDIFPPLYKAYPNKLMNIGISTYSQIELKDGQNSTLSLTAPVSLAMNVINATGDGKTLTAFTLGVPIDASIQLRTNLTMVNGTQMYKLNGALTDLGKLQSHVLSSNVGTLDLGTFNALLGFAGTELKGTINKALEKGTEIPTDIAGLVRITDLSAITSSDGYLGLALGLGSLSTMGDVVRQQMAAYGLGDLINSNPGLVLPQF